jgi:hypothetical protein
VRAVARVRGVRDVVNELDVHEQAGNVPGLQGGSTPSGLTPDILQRQWAPATRVLMGSSGTALLGYGASRRSLAGGLLAASGLGLLARAVTNFDPGRLVTMTRRPAMALQTSTAFSQRQAARLS